MTTQSFETIIGNNVARYRNMAGLTQTQLAERVGISTAFISRVERGQKMMKIQTLYKVARVLNVSCDALLSQDDIAQLENINVLLADKPYQFVIGIEKLIRICIEQFESKKEPPSGIS